MMVRCPNVSQTHSPLRLAPAPSPFTFDAHRRAAVCSDDMPKRQPDTAPARRGAARRRVRKIDNRPAAVAVQGEASPSGACAAGLKTHGMRQGMCTMH